MLPCRWRIACVTAGELPHTAHDAIETLLAFRWRIACVAAGELPDPADLAMHLMLAPFLAGLALPVFLALLTLGRRVAFTAAYLLPHATHDAIEALLAFRRRVTFVPAGELPDPADYAARRVIAFLSPPFTGIVLKAALAFCR